MSHDPLPIRLRRRAATCDETTAALLTEAADAIEALLEDRQKSGAVVGLIADRLGLRRGEQETRPESENDAAR